ncbi:MAG TPA: response regulator transcription factor [Bacteroidales bacterium]|nr:response regulator transcription factor [Bacteroidales bacterium]
MEKIKVVIVDDHTLFRDGLKLILSKSDEVEVVGEAADGKEFLDKYPKLADVIVLMDIEMPVISGIEATRLAVERNPESRIIALTMFEEYEYYYQMIEAGAKGFLLKNSSIDQVLQAVKEVAKGENYFSKELLLAIVQNMSELKTTQSKTDNLSEREIEVLHLICKGYSNQEIAEKLFLSKRTVDKHRANILEKTGSKNTASMVMYALKNKIIRI